MVASVSATLRTRGLGLSALLALPIAVVGCCSLGTKDVPTLLQNEDELTEDFGFGPGPSMVAAIGKAAGWPLIFTKAETTTAGQLGAYHQRGEGSAAAGTMSSVTGSGTAIPALTGTPDKSCAVRVRVTTAGSNLAATPVVQISLDGGLTWLAAGAVTASATPQAIGSTGLLLAFTDGTFVLNDYWTAQGANCPTDADATGASVPAFTGTPRDAFDVRVAVTRSATTAGDGTGAVRYSLDGGTTYAPEQPVPTSRAVVLGDSGITVTFSAASLVDGDEYYIKTSAPVFTAAAMAASLTALRGVSVADHEGIVIAGAIDATYFDEITTAHDALIAASKPRYIIGHARGQAAAIYGETAAQWASALLGATPGFSGANANMVLVAAGECTKKDGLHGDAVLRRSVLFDVAARLAAIDVAEHPGRVRSGPLDIETLLHDLADSTLVSLDTQGFIGAQSIVGVEGFYATRRTRAAAGSDFDSIMRVRVMCFACRAALARMVEEVNESIPVNANGTIRADVADGIDASVTSYMTRELGRRVSSVSVQVSRTADLVSTSTLPFKVRVVPLGYSEAITLDLGYTLARSA